MYPIFPSHLQQGEKVGVLQVINDSSHLIFAVPGVNQGTAPKQTNEPEDCSAGVECLRWNSLSPQSQYAMPRSGLWLFGSSSIAVHPLHPWRGHSSSLASTIGSVVLLASRFPGLFIVICDQAPHTCHQQYYNGVRVESGYTNVCTQSIAGDS